MGFDHWLAPNITLWDFFNSGLKKKNDSNTQPEDGWFEEMVGAGVGGGVGILVVLVGLVAVLYRYWGAFEPLARALTRLVQAVTNLVRRRDPNRPPTPPPRTFPRNFTDSERIARQTAQRIAIEAQEMQVYSVVNPGHYV